MLPAPSNRNTGKGRTSRSCKSCFVLRLPVMNEFSTDFLLSGKCAGSIAEGATQSNGAEEQGSQSTISPAAKNKAHSHAILIVEDDVSLAGFLAAELEELNLDANQVHDGEEALQALESSRRYDLLILDLNLPKVDGLTILTKVRPKQPKLPILVLTARSGVEHRVRALNSGSDDCLTKPFSLLEFTARVQALLRRNSGPVPNCSSVADLKFDRDQRRVERRGRRIELTPREYALLDVMMQNAGRPVSRATLLEEVWSTSSESPTNIVDVYMKYLRDKIDLPGEVRLIHTIRGFGYELRAS